jgi:glutaredoxin-like YruB-family protein
MNTTVTIYSTPTCHFCQMAKEYFKAHDVAFTDYDVASDLEKRQEMLQKSGQMGVPVIFIGDEMVIGFDQERIASLLPKAAPAEAHDATHDQQQAA